MTQAQTVVIVLCKSPELGRVKTRLAVTVGATRALGVYQYLLTRTFDALRDVDASIVVCADGDLSKMPQHSFTVLTQRGEDLGARMLHALQDVGPVKSAILIGTDSPMLNGSIISSAIEMLRSADVVLGPSTDLGYYLVGFNSPIPDIFRDMPWSTCRVLERTYNRCDELGLRTILLEPLTDIDTRADIEELLGGGRDARRTYEEIMAIIEEDSDATAHRSSPS